MSFNHTAYYETGDLKAEMNLVEGAPDGVVNNYWPNGQLMLECVYENRMLQGEQKAYAEDGTLEGTLTYDAGSITHENGVLVELPEEE